MDEHDIAELVREILSTERSPHTFFAVVPAARKNFYVQLDHMNSEFRIIGEPGDTSESVKDKIRRELVRLSPSTAVGSTSFVAN